jgi:hypothetical protein
MPGGGPESSFPTDRVPPPSEQGHLPSVPNLRGEPLPRSVTRSGIGYQQRKWLRQQRRSARSQPRWVARLPLHTAEVGQPAAAGGPGRGRRTRPPAVMAATTTKTTWHPLRLSGPLSCAARRRDILSGPALRRASGLPWPARPPPRCGSGTEAISSSARSRVAPRSLRQPACRSDNQPAEPADPPAPYLDRSQPAARQERPAPRPTLGWPRGQAAGWDRRASESPDRRRSPAVPTACGHCADDAPRPPTMPAPQSAAVARPVAASPRPHHRGARSDVGPARRSAYRRDPSRASPQKQPARQQVRRRAPQPRRSRRLQQGGQSQQRDAWP